MCGIAFFLRTRPSRLHGRTRARSDSPGRLGDAVATNLRAARVPLTANQEDIRLYFKFGYVPDPNLLSARCPASGSTRLRHE
jgi:hypothetical protein